MTRISTTHVGSLPRPQNLLELMYRHQEGAKPDDGLADAIEDAVRVWVATQLPTSTTGTTRPTSRRSPTRWRRSTERSSMQASSSNSTVPTSPWPGTRNSGARTKSLTPPPRARVGDLREALDTGRQEDHARRDRHPHQPRGASPPRRSTHRTVRPPRRTRARHRERRLRVRVQALIPLGRRAA